VVKGAPATASGIGKIGQSRVEKLTDDRLVKANAAWIVETGTSGPTSAPGAAIGVTAARPEVTDPRSIPLLVRK
jgi:hypothetical protein